MAMYWGESKMSQFNYYMQYALDYPYLYETEDCVIQIYYEEAWAFYNGIKSTSFAEIITFGIIYLAI